MSSKTKVKLKAKKVNQKKLLDEEKATYLFNKKEIKEINKDLNEIDATINKSSEIENPKKIAAEVKKLEKIWTADKVWAAEKEMLFSFDPDVRGNENGKIYVNTVEVETSLRKEELNRINKIDKELANQKGLSKLWTVKEKLGIKDSKDISEPEAFGNLVRSPNDIEKEELECFSNHRLFDGKEVELKTAVTCEDCKGTKKKRILFFCIKCPTCHGSGLVTKTLKEFRRYYNNEFGEIILKKQNSENTNKGEIQ